jgi:HlyD family secretion protein
MKKLLIGLGILAVVAVIVIVSLSRTKQSGEGVYSAEVSKGDVITLVTGTGVVQARTKVNVSSEIYGQIVELAVKEGQNVSKGDLLVRIDPEKYRSDVDRLAANVRMSRIAIEQQEVNLRNLERERRRAQELHAEGLLPDSDLEKADLAVEDAAINLKSLRESVTLADASLSRVQTDLTKTKIFAPMTGRVTQINTEVGEQVIVGTTNIPGSVLMVISDMSEVLAEISVDETEVVRLSPGQKAKLTVDAVEKTTYEGKVHEIRNTARKEGDVNVFGVKILLSDPDERLRPGMTAKARIEVARRDDVVRIPIQAVTVRERKKLEEDRKAAGGKGSAAPPAGPASPVGEKDAAGAGGATPAAASGANPGKADEREEIEVVYLFEGSKTAGTVRAQPVTTGTSDDLWVEIVAGLAPGKTVVTGPYRVLRNLKEGDRVQPREEKQPGDAAAEDAGGDSRERGREGGE